jgi:hypothetical protein
MDPRSAPDAQGTREMGVRMAIGAALATVRPLIVWQA